MHFEIRTWRGKTGWQWRLIIRERLGANDHEHFFPAPEPTEKAARRAACRWVAAQ